VSVLCCLENGLKRWIEHTKSRRCKLYQLIPCRKLSIVMCHSFCTSLLRSSNLAAICKSAKNWLPSFSVFLACSVTKLSVAMIIDQASQEVHLYILLWNVEYAVRCIWLVICWYTLCPDKKCLSSAIAIILWRLFSCIWNLVKSQLCSKSTRVYILLEKCKI